MASLTLFPLQYQRQDAVPIDLDSVFATTAARTAYLSSARRYAGMQVYDLEIQRGFFLNAARTAWLPIGTGAYADLTGAPTLAAVATSGLKADVGLGNVDNTSDVNKPVSTAQQTALNLKADASSVTKTAIGLGNVDNTADTAKPVSTAQQTALNLKANLASPTFTGSVQVPNATAGDNTNLAANTAFVTAAVAQGKADLVASAPGLLDTLNELATAIGDDPSFSATMATSLGNRLRVDTATQGLSAPQKANAVTNLGLAAVASSGAKADVGLGNVDNTADTAKPVSTAQQTALNLKADASAVTLTALGLNNVTNTSDANKPISTAQQTALNLKQDASAKDATGGYVGLTAFAHNFWNALGTFKSLFTNANTAARTYLFPDKSMTVAGLDDVTWAQLPDKPSTLGGYGVTSVAWSAVTGHPTTIAGYGITDNTFANLGAKPTTVSGYGITDIPAQVQADWTATTGGAVILHKPTTLAGFGITLSTADLADYVDPVGMSIVFGS